MKGSACFTLLDFEPSKVPSFQQCKLRSGNVPSVSEMLDYILKARQCLKRISKYCADSRIENAVEKLEVLFIYHTCQQEDIGIANKDIIMQIIKNSKDGKCRDYLKNSENSAYQETVNLYEAYKMLQKLGREEAELDPDLKGLLEVDSYIIGTHKCLMRGLSMKTRGGLFSTEVRHTMADGELHEYPKFETVDEARDAVLRIVDRYNMLCFSIKHQEHQDEHLFVQNIFKCATWLFYELLSLHPFGDGNGRLCRLILNYAIHVIMPFPVPLHDVFRSSRDMYLHAMIAPRKSDGRPTELIRLLIESTYNCCKKFLKLLYRSMVTSCRFHDHANGSMQRNVMYKMPQVGSYVVSVDECMMFKKAIGTLFSTEVHQMMVNVLCQHPEFVRYAVMKIVNRSNMLCYSMKEQEHQHENLFVQNIFKCATWLFHKLLSLHSFGDENGRLCLLILNYAIRVFVPFPGPLHDIFRSSQDMYLHASSKSYGRTTGLIRLCIESAYKWCKKFSKLLCVGSVG